MVAVNFAYRVVHLLAECGLSHKIRIPAMLTISIWNAYFFGIDLLGISVPEYLFVSIAGIRILWDRPQRWTKRWALGCEKFLPGPAWLLHN